MKEYSVPCPGCSKTITVEMDEDDERRKRNEFFIIKCDHCNCERYAKIFESLSVYPFKLMVEVEK